MGNLTIATIFIVTLNLLMWFSGMAMVNVNPTGTFCYSGAGTIIDQAITNSGNLSVLDNDIINQLPTSSNAVVSAGSTSIQFTDIFNNVLSWFKSAPGIKYIYGVISAPYNILKCLGLGPAYNVFIVGIGTLWYLVSFLVLIAFMWGRD